MKRERIFAMDFIRTIATIIIIIYHFNISVQMMGITAPSVLTNQFANITLDHIGVPLFFVLSGYALMLSSENNYSLSGFYKKRFLSIYPLFWMGYFFVTVYYFLKYHSIHPWGERPSAVSFLLTVFGLDGYTAALMPNWYRIGEWFLGCIIIIYLIFPFLRWSIQRFPKISWIPWAILYIYLTFNYNSPIDQTFHVFMRLPEFLIGMYLYKYVKQFKLIPTLICTLGILLTLLIPMPFIPKTVFITSMGICCFTVCFYIGNLIKKSAIQRPFLWFSKYSFAIYLLHHVISEQIIQRFYSCTLTSVELYLLFIIVLIFDILGGYILFRVTNYLLTFFITDRTGL